MTSRRVNMKDVPMSKRAAPPMAAAVADERSFARVLGIASNAHWASTFFQIFFQILNGTGAAISRSIRVWLDYRRALRELGGLTDHDLRDLRFKKPDFYKIAWDEAQRQCNERP